MAAKLSLVLCVVAMCALINMGHGASSPRRNAPAPAPAVDCASLVLTMADCLSFVSNGSNTTKPEGTCCAGLKNVMKTSPQCLCEAFRSSAQFGVVLNVTRAKSLPAACKLSSSPVGDCGLSEAPGAAPGGSQSGESSPSPALGGELSPATAPTPGKNSASELHPISATSLLISMLVAAFSAFGFQHS